jgi:hypothetical protein
VRGGAVGFVATLATVACSAGLPAGPLPPIPPPPPPPPAAAAECDRAKPEWIWCDDFERDRLASYFEHDRAGGRFARMTTVGVDASWGMRARWNAAGEISAGALHLAFGRTPDPAFRPVDQGSRDYREVFWRLYLRNEPGWTGGGGNKLSRAIVFATAGWAQAAVAHVWSGSPVAQQEILLIDPASGTDLQGVLKTTQYNDFPNFRWLGARSGSTRLFSPQGVGRWYCVEAQMRLNNPGSADGEFRLWIDGRLEAERTDLNWLGRYDRYGINAVFLENYWNDGATKAQARYFDRFVVSTARIGC